MQRSELESEQRTGSPGVDTNRGQNQGVEIPDQVRDDVDGVSVFFVGSAALVPPGHSRKGYEPTGL